MSERERLKIDTSMRRDTKPRDQPESAKHHWRIYYSDGTYLGSHQASWEQAPNHHIVAIVQAWNDEPAAVELGTPYYWNVGDWIFRVQDPTLYLRQTGLVKFGRWAKHSVFSSAWKHALKEISTEKVDLSDDEHSIQAGATCTMRAARAGEAGPGWKLWLDDMEMYSSEDAKWEQVPTDGIMCAVFSLVHYGLKIQFAVRRHTYYFWRRGELVNTDDMGTLLAEFPQCKYGQPSFEGKSYLHHAESITAAMRDTLEDVRKG